MSTYWAQRAESLQRYRRTGEEIAWRKRQRELRWDREMMEAERESKRKMAELEAYAHRLNHECVQGELAL